MARGGPLRGTAAGGAGSTDASPGGAAARSVALRVLGVVAVATVLRPPIAAVGPVLADVRSDLGLSAPQVSLLTALPVLCFGAGAFAAPWVARRLGIGPALAVVLALLAGAATVRVVGGPAILFAGTFLAGCAIAVANVLLPAVVKAGFPRHVGVMTGGYTATLAAAAALSALVAVPLGRWTGLGWRAALGVWGMVAFLALLAWLPQLRERRQQQVSLVAPHPARRLALNGTALAVTAFMGLQSLGFYAVLTWLPSLLRDNGYSPQTAGALLSLVAVLGIPVGLTVPAFAARLPDQRAVAVSLTALIGAGFLGLLLAPTTATLLWVVLLGLGLGATFPLALLLVVLRSSAPAATSQLSAMAQGFGYLLAAAGPFVVGAVYERTGGWDAPLAVLVGVTVLQAGAGWRAGRAGTAA